MYLNNYRLSGKLIIFLATLLFFLIIAPSISASPLQQNFAMPQRIYPIQYPQQVNNLFNQLKPSVLKDDLIFLTNFPDRSSETNSGVLAAEKIKSKLERLITFNNRSKDAFIIP